MTILEQLRSDLVYLYQLLEDLKINKSRLNPEDSEYNNQKNILDDKIARKNAEIVSLNAILQSGIALKSYQSFQTGRRYYENPIKHASLIELSSSRHSMFCRKFSRKNLSIENSIMQLYDYDKNREVAFSIEHKPDGLYPDGGLAQKVKKAFLNEESESKYNIDSSKHTPKFALKVFKNLSTFNNLHQLRYAMRGAWCNRLLGRSSVSFRRNNKHYLLCSWLEGEPLDSYKFDELEAIPVFKRLILVLDLIKELAVLHACGVVHSDIKPSNIMLNLAEQKIHMFDFDSIRLENEVILGVPSPIYTPRFLKPEVIIESISSLSSLWRNINKQSDMYALGLTLAFLFSDIVRPHAKIVSRTLQLNDKPKSVRFETLKVRPYLNYSDHSNIGDIILDLTGINVNRNISSHHREKRCTNVIELFEKFKEILLTEYRFNLNEEDYAKIADIEDICMYTPELGKQVLHDEIEVEILAYNEKNKILRLESAQEAENLPKMRMV